jgi:phosphoenolpyruvate synthase/pyruvate phosphate dikinase
MSKTVLRLDGKVACRGIVSGPPQVVLSTNDLNKVQVGDILVAKETDISFVPAMLRASGIITECGGRFCHAAVWARENNKPVLLQVPNATDVLALVDLVHLDADLGNVWWEQ